jgi:hypothetical protein
MIRRTRRPAAPPTLEEWFAANEFPKELHRVLLEEGITEPMQITQISWGNLVKLYDSVELAKPHTRARFLNLAGVFYERAGMQHGSSSSPLPSAQGPTTVVGYTPPWTDRGSENDFPKDSPHRDDGSGEDDDPAQDPGTHRIKKEGADDSANVEEASMAASSRDHVGVRVKKDTFPKGPDWGSS